LESHLKKDREQGFDLSEPPLLRLSVILKGRDSRVILLSLHHLLLDGWSSSLVYKEAQSLYECYVRGEELQLPKCRPYGDYIAWLQKQDTDAAEAYWRSRLRGYTGPPPLGVGLPPGSRHEAVEYDTCESRVPPTITDAIRRLARTSRLTLNTIVQGAWALLLSRYSGDEDVLLGTTVSGRPAELEGIESMIGLFINTLPVRIRVSPRSHFREWFRELQTNQAAAQQFEYVSLSQIHSWSEVPREAPMFETLIGFENFPALGGETSSNDGDSDVRLFSQTNYPLTLAVIPGATDWQLKVMYARPRFETAEMKRLLTHFQQLLTSIANNPDRRLADAVMLTDAEQRQLIDWNDTATNYPRDTTIHQLFEEQVERTPDAVAITAEGEYLTYNDLNRRANRLARHLRLLGVESETVVGVCGETPIELVVSMLGVLKAGGAYLPLDQSYPEERLLFMLQDSGAQVLVRSRALARMIPAGSVECISLEDIRDEEKQTDDRNLPNWTVPENLAYVMYTSGSTGGPKGTEITHRAVIRLVRETDYVTLGTSNVIAQIANVCFDAATFEIWGALLNGPKIAGISRFVALSPEDFSIALRDHRVSTIFVTTDLFNQLVRTKPDVFRSVETLLVGGSAINVKWIETCLSAGPPERLLHVYGPTESTTFASWHRVEDVPEGATSIPIGKPLSNTQLYVLDRSLSQVCTGVAGEIYIGGDGLARGYRNRPELTAEKFVPNPFGGQRGSRLYRTGDRARRGADGAIEFLGRFDDQVKVRGFRVEPGEIEALLKRHPEVSDAVVLARRDVPESTRLAAYVVPRNGKLITSDLRHLLETKLPDYMVPLTYVLCDELPLTPNGKVDRKALAAREERYSPKEAYVEPRSPAEKTLAGIWSEVLARESVSIHDNFFELGGDSILSIQIIARAREAGLGLTLRQLFQNQTVAKLAAVAGTVASSRAETGELLGDLPLLPVQHWFFEQELVNLHHFNQASLIELPAGLNVAWLTQATNHLFLHHDALRLRFRRDTGQWRQFYGPSGQTPFEVRDLSALAPSERQSVLDSEVARIQESLNVESGPVALVVWFNFGAQPGRLLFLAHHLVVDTVSWRILMEDFWHAYGQLAKGEAVSLPAKTSSLRQWASRLEKHAQSSEIRAELSYWTTAASGKGCRVPQDFQSDQNLAATADSVTLELDESKTRELLQQTPKAYQTQINDVLLTALARVLSNWIGESTVTFDLEGHGREPLFEDIDLTRTVGWFTTIFPVRLQVVSKDPGEALKAVKEQLRQVPNRGLTYGLLRYLTAHEEVDNHKLLHLTPDVAFNYLGQFSEAQELDSTAALRSLAARRPHLIEVSGAVCAGRLRMAWEFSTVHHRRATIECIAADFMEQLGKLIIHCRSITQVRFTPSDFAQAGISQNELDKLVAVVDGSERPAG
jgi:amino acid adenylation domain-containing protein/non-ribosomal peptide synthase protein (TIGR01720 family)